MVAVAKAIFAGEWRPSKWEDFAGNYRIVEYWKQMVHSVRFCGARQGFNALMIGESGSGKTATTEFGLMCLGCLNLDSDTLNPCGSCAACKDKYHKHGHCDWRDFINFVVEDEIKTPVHLHYMAVDCPRLTSVDLGKLLQELKDGDGFTQIISLDEIHTLVRSNLDDKLLKSMEVYPAIWIGMSACINNTRGGRQPLEQMLINRFHYVLPTERPTDYDFKMWCLTMSETFGVSIENERTLDEMVIETNRVMRRALHILTIAQNTSDRVLTKELIRKTNLLK